MSLKGKTFVAKMHLSHRDTGVETEPGYIPDVSHCTEDELLILVEMGAIEVMPPDYVAPPAKLFDENGVFVGYAPVEASVVEEVKPASKVRKAAKAASESEG